MIYLLNMVILTRDPPSNSQEAGEGEWRDAKLLGRMGGILSH